MPASLSDLSEYRIPSGLIHYGLFLSLLIRLWTEGAQGIFSWMLGAVIPLILCFVLYIFRMVGASDIKLFSIIGSFYSVTFCLRVMVVSVLLGAAMAVGKMLICHNARERFSYLMAYLSQLVITRRITPYYTRQEQGDQGVVPFVIAISFAVLLCRK